MKAPLAAVSVLSPLVLLLAADAQPGRGNGPAARPKAVVAVAVEPEPVADLPTRVRAIIATGEPAPDGSAAIAIDEAAWAVMNLRDAAWLDEVPLSDGSTVDLRMQRVDPYAAGARIVVMEAAADGRTVERNLELPAISAWRGSVAGAADSVAFLARSAAGLHGYVQFQGRLEFISSGDPMGGDVPMVSNADALEIHPFSCNGALAPQAGLQDDLEFEMPPTTSRMAAGTCRQIPLAFETDQELLARFGGNTTTASAYVATMTAALMDIYRRDFEGRPALSYLRWWTTNDPWTQTGTCGGSGANQLSELRTYWNANMRSTPRALTAMLSGRGLGGGCAWLSSTCDSVSSGYGYSVSADLNGSFPYPVVSRNSQNWDLIVVAHEIGHNLSAQHTHDIGVDGCGNNDCTLRTQGTIMSYCHLCSGGVSNINMNFASANVSTIVSHLGSRSCTAPTVALPVAVADAFAAQEGFESMLDVLANDLASNCESVSITNLPASSALGVPLAVDATGGPGGGPAIRYLPPAGVSGTDSFTYRLRDASAQSSATVTVSVDVRPSLLAFEGSVIGETAGLRARYYAVTGATTLPDFDALTPYQFGGTVASLSFTSTSGACVGSGRSDNVGAVFEGWVTVPTSGSYLWALVSDAGSQLWIDGRLVVDHDGLHSYSEKGATMYTEAGRHFVQIRYFEATGSCGLLMRWTPPGGSKVTVPASALSNGGAIYDIDASGQVDSGDIAQLLLSYGVDCASSTRPCYSDAIGRQRLGDGPCECPEDLDGSGGVDAGDIALLLLNFS
jgi:hypothetical protein